MKNSIQNMQMQIQNSIPQIKILLTNDDGCSALGLNVLFDALNASKKYQVVAIAPQENRSGIGSAVTLAHPIEINKIRHNFYAINANPVDCVIAATSGILKHFDNVDFYPDLVISGINKGSNFSQTIFGSGTMAAAMYANVMYKIPALAVSLAYDSERFFDANANFDNPNLYLNYQFATSVILKIVENLNWQQDFLLNINIPNFPNFSNVSENSTDPKIKLTKFIDTQHFEKSTIQPANSPRKQNLFWLPNLKLNKHKVLNFAQNSDLPNDIFAVMQQQISVTPINTNITSINNTNFADFKYLEQIKINNTQNNND